MIATAREANLLSPAQRWCSGIGSLAGGVLLGVSAWLDPSPAGMGTHTQLGIPQCAWPGSLGMPCPSCGMTTAFALAADGRFLDSFCTQPAGFVLAVCAACLTAVLAISAFTGARLASAVVGSLGSAGGWLLVGIMVLGWAYKIVVTRGVS